MWKERTWWRVTMLTAKATTLRWIATKECPAAGHIVGPAKSMPLAFSVRSLHFQHLWLLLSLLCSVRLIFFIAIRIITRIVTSISRSFHFPCPFGSQANGLLFVWQHYQTIDNLTPGLYNPLVTYWNKWCWGRRRTRVADSLWDLFCFSYFPVNYYQKKNSSDSFKRSSNT